MKRYIIMLAVASTMLTSCKSLYSNYERPTDVQTTNLTREVTMTDDTTLQVMNWREMFTDQKLVALIEEGLQNNADIQTARLRTEEAKATLSASKKAFLPSLSFEPQGQVSSYDSGKAQKTYSLDLSAQWEADIFGSLRNQKKESEMSVYEQEAYTQATQTQLIATIAESYYTLEMLDRELLITEETVSTWEDYVRTLKVMHEYGSTTSDALDQNEASLLSARHSMEELSQQIHEQENALSTLVGRPAGSIDRGTLDDTAINSSWMTSGLSVSMLSNRPDVRQKEYALAQTFYGVNTARSAFYPSITLSGSAGFTNSNGTISNPGKMLLSAIGSLTQPIFNKGKNTANLKIAKAQYEEAKVAFSQSLLDAGEDVNNAMTQYESAKTKQAIDAKQIERLQSALRSTQLKHENSDDTSYLDVLTARQNLLSSRLTLVEDQYSEIESIISLYHSLGGGTK